MLVLCNGAWMIMFFLFFLTSKIARARTS
jgi:hypothetical protein